MGASSFRELDARHSLLLPTAHLTLLVVVPSAFYSHYGSQKTAFHV